MDKGGFRAQNWGWRAMDWGQGIKIWGFHHDTPTFNKDFSVYPLSQIPLFWGHCKNLNVPLEHDLQLFPCLKGCLPPKVIFNWSKVIFHQRLSSTEACLQSKVVFHQRLSTTKGHLPPKVFFHQRLSFTYQNILLVDLIFVRAVNIPKLSLLPCLEVA